MCGVYQHSAITREGTQHPPLRRHSASAADTAWYARAHEQNMAIEDRPSGMCITSVPSHDRIRAGRDSEATQLIVASGNGSGANGSG